MCAESSMYRNVLQAPQSHIVCDDQWCMLSFHSLPLLSSLPCFLQWGKTPLLMAAYCGRNAFIDVLVEWYHSSATDEDKVRQLIPCVIDQGVRLRSHRVA